jgi:hypothetical protein
MELCDAPDPLKPLDISFAGLGYPGFYGFWLPNHSAFVFLK